MVWLYDKDIGVIYLPIKTIEQMKKDGEKSFGVRHLESDYEYVILPGKKKVTFWNVDYSPLLQLEEGN